MTIGSNPSLISRLIWTQSNEFLGLNWRVIELQNCMDEIAEGFNVTSKNRNKKTTV